MANNGNGFIIHGHRAKNKWTAVYNTWRCMKARCDNPKHRSYKDYGGKGIKYDPRWVKFEAFFNDMGEPPKDGMAYDLDRVDSTKDYSFENCRWLERGVNRGRKGGETL